MKKYAFLNFGHIFQNVYFGYPVNSIVSSAQALRLYKIHVFDEGFFLLIIRMPMLTKLLRVLTYRKELPHKFTWHISGLIFQSHLTNEIHIFTWRRCMDTKLGKVLT